MSEINPSNPPPYRGTYHGMHTLIKRHGKASRCHVESVDSYTGEALNVYKGGWPLFMEEQRSVLLLFSGSNILCYFEPQ